jgi:hypothetical protein
MCKIKISMLIQEIFFYLWELIQANLRKAKMKTKKNRSFNFKINILISILCKQFFQINIVLML